MESVAHVFLRIIPALWLGMVIAISMVETPLKFKAPEITLERGLGIGRLVFHALNRIELAFGAVLVLAFFAASMHVATSVRITLAAAIVLLLVQVFILRPVLDTRLDDRLAGLDVGSSPHHLIYIALEVLKIISLATAAIVLAHRANG